MRGEETEVNHHGRSVTVGGKENSITPVEAGMKKSMENPPSYSNTPDTETDETQLNAGPRLNTQTSP